MRESDVQKPPGIAEAIDWLAALEPARRRGARRGRGRPHARARCSSTARTRRWSARPASSSSCAAVTELRRSASRRSSSTCRRWRGAFSRRLHEAACRSRPRARPTSRARSSSCGRSRRRRLYWTARAVFVTDPAQVKAFDAVFGAVFGARDRGEPFEPETPRPSPRRPTTGPRPPHDSSPAGRGDAGRRPRRPRRAARGRRRRAREVEVPLALASDEERARPASASTRSSPDELAQLYRLMARLELATPLRRTRRDERGRHGERIDLRRTPARQPAHRRRPDPPRPSPPPRRAAAAGAAVRHLGLDGALRAGLPAVPHLRRRQRARRRGVRVRHAAHPPHPRARARAAPSARSSAPPRPRPTGRAARASATR